MDFESLSMTTVNMGMVMAMLLILRERVARSRRRGADDMKLLLDLTFDMVRIPFFKRKSAKNTKILLGVMALFMGWMGLKNVQSLVETLVIVVIAGIMFLYMRRVDERKLIAVYDKGIVHKTGFIFFEGISDYEVSDSDEFEDAKDVWLMVGNTPRIQLHVSNAQFPEFEKLMRKKVSKK